MIRNRLRSPRSGKIAAAFLLCVSALSLALSCGGREKPSVAVKREQLFALGYGPSEDQINLFQIDHNQAAKKTCITMREGIFYIANGAGAKVVRYSSFGDPLSMIYNPEENPDPILLKAQAAPSENGGSASSAEGLGRVALPHAFRSVGELAIDSKQMLYVEDRLPPERRVQDKDSGALLDHVLLRFDKDGRFLDYLGQEGIGGTPFPYILGVYTLSSDDVVVVSIVETGWLVHLFDSNGVLLSSLRLRRSDLPMPEKSERLIASLDKIVPDLTGEALLAKVDYYKDASDASAKVSTAGAEFAGSWIYRIDLKDGKYEERWQIHAIERTAKVPEGSGIKYSRVPSLIGIAGRNFFLIYADDEGKTYVLTYDRNTRSTVKYSIDIADDELYNDAFYLSPEGVLCALLGGKYDAKVVWWRFDKLIAGTSTGIVK